MSNMDLLNSMNVSASGMRSQSMRMQVIAENIANAETAMTADGNGPYRRKIIAFKEVIDRNTGLSSVEPARIKRDEKTPLKQIYDPAHPLANDSGFVAMPNVDTSLESVNMKEASRAYEANMAALESAKEMMTRSLDLIR